MIKKVCFALSLILVSSVAFSMPTERFQPEFEVEAFALASRLQESTWVYHWRGRDYEFRFNSDGSIGLLGSWNGVRWVVTGREDVILEAANQKMLLQFNSNQNAFSTIDWDGEKASGRLLVGGK